jgi:signal-transduction protein with cAMP-binding, CBS, and nucleotidyltransferase domain
MMALLVSAKSGEVLAWRACGDFAVSFRQVLLARLEFCRSNEAEAMLMEAGQALADLITANDAFFVRSADFIGEISACAEPPRLRELTMAYFTELYDHISIYQSVPTFYEFSTQLLHALCASINLYAHTALGLLDRKMPQVKLIALGSAGRQEFSPFCPLQLMLVHSEAGDAEHETLSQFGRLIHEGFEACGFQVDETVTPRNREWRGSMPEWHQRLAQQLKQSQVNELVDLHRFFDQSVLYNDEGFDAEFIEMCRSLLKEHRSVMACQVTRVCNLSHGIGIMGGMRFEKKGTYRGKFALRDNALQPLAAVIGVLAVLKGLETPTTPQRIREILWRRELNVDMAERLLQAWHTLHELRLARERDVHPVWSNEAPLHLNVEEMPESEQTRLRESLEAVGAIQRHVGQTFSGMED